MAALTILTELLRVLTPEEISELTTSHSGNKRIDLTDLLEQVEDGASLRFDLEEDGAKILPFGKNADDEDGPETVIATYECGKEIQEYVSHFLQKMKLGETSKARDGKSVETSTFILKEKERFKYVQDKLKKKEIMSLYLKNSHVDIEQEKALKDDLSKSSRSGVLVNKKQF